MELKERSRHQLREACREPRPVTGGVPRCQGASIFEVSRISGPSFTVLSPATPL